MTDTAKRMMDAASTEALFAAAENALPGEARKAVLLAAVRRLHYNASIAQGFSPDEALTLCMESVRIE
jgi:hypothetical protein